MPLYEYECTTCHRRTEKIQKFSDPELTVCPHCGGRLERTLTAPAVQFKGSGWYKDLYSSAKPAAASGGSEGAKPAAASGGESTGGAKSETTAAPAPAAASGSSSSGSSTSGSGTSNA